MAGGIRLTTYDKAVTVKSGPQGCSDTAAPPTTSRRSSTVTRAPRLASRPAATRPLWPPPMTTTEGGSTGTARRLPSDRDGSGAQGVTMTQPTQTVVAPAARPGPVPGSVTKSACAPRVAAEATVTVTRRRVGETNVVVTSVRSGLNEKTAASGRKSVPLITTSPVAPRGSVTDDSGVTVGTSMARRYTSEALPTSLSTDEAVELNNAYRPSPEIPGPVTLGSRGRPIWSTPAGRVQPAARSRMRTSRRGSDPGMPRPVKRTKLTRLPSLLRCGNADAPETGAP